MQTLSILKKLCNLTYLWNLQIYEIYRFMKFKNHSWFVKAQNSMDDSDVIIWRRKTYCITVCLKGLKKLKNCLTKLRLVQENTYPRKFRNGFRWKFQRHPSKKIEKTFSPWTSRYFNFKKKVQNELPSPMKPSKVA